MTDRDALDRIHALMSLPYEWRSACLLDDIYSVLLDRGYKDVPEQRAASMYEHYDHVFDAIPELAFFHPND